MKCATPTASVCSDTETAWFTYDADGRLTRIRPGDATLIGRFDLTALALLSDTYGDFARTRLYDPSVGVWMSQDPVAFRGGDSNLHRYIAADPPAIPAARTPDGES
jgi:uncharacterized protein RhaS with RHS repeats